MDGTKLIDSLIAEFRRGVALIEALDEVVYGKMVDGASSVGEHFRHNLEFGRSLIDGLESARIDYGKRRRDRRIEKERGFAVQKFEELISSIDDLRDSEQSLALDVRSEVDEDLWLRSSLARELEFLHSHTVHHYALIAAKLDSLGIDLSPEFGVAPSTLKYWKSLSSKRRAA